MMKNGINQWYFLKNVEIQNMSTWAVTRQNADLKLAVLKTRAVLDVSTDLGVILIDERAFKWFLTFVNGFQNEVSKWAEINCSSLDNLFFPLEDVNIILRFGSLKLLFGKVCWAVYNKPSHSERLLTWDCCCVEHAQTLMETHWCHNRTQEDFW